MPLPLGLGPPGTATQVGAYKPHWQLLAPEHPLPPSLRPMLRLLATPQLYRLVAHLLARHVGGTQPQPQAGGSAASGSSPPAMAASSGAAAMPGVPDQGTLAGGSGPAAGGGSLPGPLPPASLPLPLGEDALLPALNLLAMALALLGAELAAQQGQGQAGAPGAAGSLRAGTPGAAAAGGGDGSGVDDGAPQAGVLRLGLDRKEVEGLAQVAAAALHGHGTAGTHHFGTGGETDSERGGSQCFSAVV